MSGMSPPPSDGASARLILGPSAAARIDRALDWLGGFDPAADVLAVGATSQAADDLLRREALTRGATFGRHRSTLPRLAAILAAEALVDRRLVASGPLAAEAIATRAVHSLTERELGRYARVADRPGFARAIAASLLEVRMAGVDGESLEELAPELAALRVAYERELEAAAIADHATVFDLACQRAGSDEPHPMLALPTLFLDVAIHHALAARLVAAVCARTDHALLTEPRGDRRTLAWIEARLETETVDLNADPEHSLSRVQVGLFQDDATEPTDSDDRVTVLSAPGEGRECVEITRRLLALARDGIPFDEMAVLLRSPEDYRPHLVAALDRAGVPAWFARGAIRPDPAGRAFLALLACRSEDLSARRFAEYLSLGEVPDLDPGGAPPAPTSRAELHARADDEMMSPRSVAVQEEERFTTEEAQGLADPESQPVYAGSLQTPRHWERLIVDASVIGGSDRWRSRLAGLREQLALQADEARRSDEHEEMARSLTDEIARLDRLRDFALPLLDDLQALPRRASWGDWLQALCDLATRSLRRPRRVIDALMELEPMATVDGIDFEEVRIVLARRLLETYVPPERDRMGKVFVAPIDQARGLRFRAVVVPGLAERLFPRPISEEPILLDAARARLPREGGDPALSQNTDRVAAERMLLHVAVGAASERLFLSYPRLEVEQARPRVPSFYGLEALRAAEGRLPGFDELATRAETVTEARIGWPAPRDAEHAIDEAEYDLATLEKLLVGGKEQDGAARYLVTANPHLGRALRFRARRWLKDWTAADGLVLPGDRAREIMRSHELGARSFSPTALQNFAQCPYRFFLYAVHRLAKREVPERIDEIDPLTRGSLVHDALFHLSQRMKERGLLPLDESRLVEARQLLDDVLVGGDDPHDVGVAGNYRDRLNPAIDKVWEDGIQSIRADLREFLRLMSVDDTGFVPWRFELSFGLGDRLDRTLADEHSTPEAVALDCGIQLRGSIDLVERREDGLLRVTDYKTGKVKVTSDQRIAGGQSLQPILYALTIERLLPDAEVGAGRLYYCTSAGGFEDRVVPLDKPARDAADTVARSVGAALKNTFLPALPDEKACLYCDYKTVCGPYEEHRTSRKSTKETTGLVALRRSR